MQDIKHAIEFYRTALLRFGFNHNIPRNIAQAIRVMYGHDGAQALALVNAEAGQATVPSAPSLQTETIILASGATSQQSEPNERAEQQQETTVDAKKKRKEPRRGQTTSRKRQPARNKDTKGAAADEKGANGNDWPWPEE
jgi:hypothetical protein